jgi:hypothetical protein
MPAFTEAIGCCNFAHSANPKNPNARLPLLGARSNSKRVVTRLSSARFSVVSFRKSRQDAKQGVTTRNAGREAQPLMQPDM